MPFTYFSLFSGIGGFELGIAKACAGKKQKPVCVGYSEIDPYAIKIYNAHFSKHKNFGDITKIKTETLPDFNLLVGGFPCQSFSIAGKRLGFDDKRGTLFFEIVRILRDKRPRHFVLENVKGLLSHDGGRTFKVIIHALAALGYSVEWQVLNSKDFGIPQNRERVFIVGYHGDKSSLPIFPLKGVTPKTRGTDQAQKGSKPVFAVTNSSTQEFGWRTDCCPTLCAGDSKNHKLVRVGRRMRWLTPIESERLQGFPDNWTEGVSVTRRYKCLGNAVTVNVIERVIRVLFENIQKAKSRLPVARQATKHLNRKYNHRRR